MGERYVASELIEAIDDIERGETFDDVVRLFSGFVERFGFTSVVLGHLINPATAPSLKDGWFVANTWPDEWFSAWRDNQLIIHDPIARLALKTNQPFAWRQAYERGSKFGKSILDESRNFGFRDGLAIPIRSIDGPPGCVSLGAERIDLSPRELACVQLVAIHAYMRLEALYGAPPYQEPASLTKRELDVLHYAAAGKTNWEIGKIFSISEHSVRDHIQSIMRKLGCANRAHAVAAAIQRNIIFP